MNRISFNDVPDGYVLCTQSDCPMASHCLRQMAMQVLTDRERTLRIANPLLTLPSEQCEFYRSDEPQVYARGFVAMQQEMLPRHYKVFMHRLLERFGRTGYFERRRGERLCTPTDIKAIEALLQDLGLQHLDFDAYEHHYNWND